MPPASDSPNDPVLSEFLELWSRDLLQGEVKPLENYLSRFPGHDALIRKAFVATDLSTVRDVDAPRAAASSASGIGIGDRLGPYLLEAELGRGGQGVVYRALDERVGRPVALKILLGWAPPSPEVMLRFRREALVASRLDDPGICTVYDTGAEMGVPYIAMRYVEGASLAQLIAEGRSGSKPDESTCVLLGDWQESSDDQSGSQTVTRSEALGRSQIKAVLRLFEKAAQSLHVAHEAGVIHRDIKPGNFMVTPKGDPVLTDFGLARSEDEDLHTLTRTGQQPGSPAYMSPEQLVESDQRLDRRTDVWSLGVSLYECLTLHRPFECATRDALFHAIRNQEPEDPRIHNPDLPRDLSTVVLTALSKQLDKRYQTAGDLAEDLRRVRQVEPIRARPITTWNRIQRWAQRNAALATAMGAAFILLLVGTAVSTKLALTAQAEASSKKKALVREQSAFTKYRQTAEPALLRYLLTEAKELWPRRESKLSQMHAWLDQAKELRGSLIQRQEDLRNLRKRAKPSQVEDNAEEKRARIQKYPELYARLKAARASVAGMHRTLKGRITNGTEDSQSKQISDAVARLKTLNEDPRLSERNIWRFDESGDTELHRVLAEMDSNRDTFLALVQEVEARIDFARSLRKMTIDDAKAAWDLCIRDLSSADHYGGFQLRPQVGLIPLGRDKDSKLWEFWQVDSGERPKWEGDALSGRVIVTAASGIVLVLLPGNRFTMGAQKSSPQAPNYDPLAKTGSSDGYDESYPHEIELNPFLLSKFELSQAQWRRLTGSNPCFLRRRSPQLITDLHPITTISWTDCDQSLKKWDLVLPTEAQWEYACRAGSSEPFHCDESALNQFANLADIGFQKTLNAPAGSFEADLEDGYGLTAPVNALSPNPFGLHSMHGNVWEWCRDHQMPYSVPARQGNGLRVGPPGANRSARGGSYAHRKAELRSSNRSGNVEQATGDPLGVRAAYEIKP